MYRYTLNLSESEFKKLKIESMKPPSLCKLDITCPIGHKIEMTYNHFMRPRRCGICSNDKIKIPYPKIKLNIQVNNYILKTTENEFIDNKLNVRSPLTIQCPKKHIFKSSYDNFVGKQKRCKQCWINTNIGKNHPSWNPNKDVRKFLRKGKPSNIFISNNFKHDKNYKNWLLDPSVYSIDHIYPVYAFFSFLIENELLKNDIIKSYLRENVINKISNLQIMDQKQNRHKSFKYNKKKFMKYMKDNGYLDEIERLKNEI